MSARLPTPHANRGAAWETALEYQHNAYAAQRVALLCKIPTPVVTPRGADGALARPFYARKSIADYLGVWTANGGKALAVEAKEASGPRWAFAKLPEHQRDFLAVWSLSGGVALVVLHWTATDETWVMDWTTLRTAMSGSARSLRRADGSPGATVAGLDYLAAYGRGA